MNNLRKTLNLSLHLIVGWACVLVTLYLACFMVPEKERILGNSYLIFFFHFPSAINCLLFFLIAGVIAAVQLGKRSVTADLASASAIEVGLLACSICLGTGMVWADAAWGKPWVWHDPRLMTVAVMWLCYVAYIVFRVNVENPEARARFSAVLAVIFAINVPLVWGSIRYFGPKVSHPMDVPLHGPYMRTTQWFGALAFLILYCALWRLRYRSMLLRTEVDRIDETLMAQRI